MNNFLNEVSGYLNELEIEHEVVKGAIQVNRDSICNCMFPAVTGSNSEDESYKLLLGSLNNKFPPKRFSYSFKTDEWLLLEVVG